MAQPVVQPHGIFDQGVKVPVAVQIAHGQAIGRRFGAEALAAVGEPALPIIQPHLVGVIQVRHECVQIAVAVEVRQHHALAI